MSETSPLLAKTRELCASIVEEPEFTLHFEKVERFVDDSDARTQFIQLSQRGDELRTKQEQGAAPTEEEIRDFQSMQSTVMENAVVKDFVEAQQELQSLYSMIADHVAKTLELGRVPEQDDFEGSGDCGEGCGCH